MTKRCPVPNLVLTSPLIRTLETSLHIFPFANDVEQDIHIVVVSHGSFMEYLLPLSHTIQPGWQKFKPAEMRTYVMDEDGHLDETVESRGARSTAVLQNVSLSLTSASD
ncbi:hypothetical protein BofuT4_P138410.1 [Botrytis cinerea T4]|uniref:Phosphoglycerate mutase family protein n=1 Tax=Botryotinia fuckeliana (strain T4) TaxID=999810 RepID=G2YMR9_BOTF4|nr:hypothetical protein BofuT4_P138410.1 [Botrytis cinerea T4]